ncbi:DUF2510 domain-containing protein [Lapillicoccus sp.]|uniref:DUF2510 domain-containing protein n=1 Tax=Lapillicoccus sp. TaxID=1909287 RepID=UPI00398324EE
MSDQPTPLPGWYPHGGGQRYWDGRSWTGHVAPIQQPQDWTGPGQRPLPSRPVGLVQGQYGMVPAIQVAPKNPALALLASFFIPGLGSMLNGEVGKGVGILIGYAVCWVLSFVLIGIPGLIAFWVWGLVDAYQGAQKWNARHGILS